ncbi:MAG TPA: sarcosine oxidase subunit gamma family protein [Gemmatimonadales bacterium]|nr:sarcosine oxidase subunit gamma family protein [Gemmatimonadales bacterium]
MPTPLRHSALHHRLLAAGAQMRPSRGWEQAETFGNRAAEAAALASAVVLADVSAQYLLLAQAQDLAAWLPLAPAIGCVALVANGGSPTRCCRLTADSALFLSADPIELRPSPAACGHRTDLTSGFTIVAVAGPRSVDLLRATTQVDLRPRAFPDGRCVQSSLARVPATILRGDRRHVPAYEILVPRDFGEYVWDALLDAGGALGVTVVGAAAIEMGD